MTPERAQEADSYAHLILQLKGLTSGASRLIPLTLYLEVVLLAGWMALWAGFDGGNTLRNIGIFYAFHAFAIVFPMMIWFLLALLFPMPEIPQWLIDWFLGHLLILINLYVIILCAIYFVAVLRVLARPRHVDRSMSFSYVLLFPSIPLIATIILDLRKITLIGFGSNQFRVIALLLWILYVTVFGYLRREGERMRAFPSILAPRLTGRPREFAFRVGNAPSVRRYVGTD